MTDALIALWELFVAVFKVAVATWIAWKLISILHSTEQILVRKNREGAKR